MKPFSFASKFCLFVLFASLSSCIKKDLPPTISNQVFSIKENSSVGTVVDTIIATDEDGVVSSYSIVSGNIGNAFTISETNGELKVANAEALDYEIHPSFTLLIKVKDDKNKYSTAEITVNLVNVVPPTAGLILYLPFDRNMKDSSGNHNDGIDYTSDNYVQGRRSMALDFNGTSDYLKLTSSLNITSGLSFSFWLKTRGANGTENNGNIISKYTMAGVGRGLLLNSFGYKTSRASNRIGLAFYNDGYSSNRDDLFSYMEQADLAAYSNPTLWTISNPLNLVPGIWTQCVVNVTSTKIEIWINGVICTSKTREYTSYFNSATEPTYIGNIYYAGEGNNNHFNGLLDEFRVYNRGLTNDEIQVLYKE